MLRGSSQTSFHSSRVFCPRAMSGATQLKTIHAPSVTCSSGDVKKILFSALAEALTAIDLSAARASWEEIGKDTMRESIANSTAV